MIPRANHQFYRFIVVGVINSLFWYLVFSILIFMKMPYPIAVLGATIIGVLFNFKSFGVLVFKNTNNKLIYKFIFVYIIIYFFNILFLYTLEFLGNDNMYVNGIIITPIAALLSFILNKYFVFNILSKD